MASLTSFLKDLFRFRKPKKVEEKYQKVLSSLLYKTLKIGDEDIVARVYCNPKNGEPIPCSGTLGSGVYIYHPVKILSNDGEMFGPIGLYEWMPWSVDSCHFIPNNKITTMGNASRSLADAYTHYLIHKSFAISHPDIAKVVYNNEVDMSQFEDEEDFERNEDAFIDRLGWDESLNSSKNNEDDSSSEID